MEDEEAVSDTDSLLKHKDYYSRRHIASCTNENCSLHTHSIKLNSDTFFRFLYLMV